MDLFFWVEPGRQPSARNPLALGVACAACHSSLGNAPPWNQERIGKSLAESSCLATNGHSTPRWSRSSEGDTINEQRRASKDKNSFPEAGPTYSQPVQPNTEKHSHLTVMSAEEGNETSQHLESNHFMSEFLNDVPFTLAPHVLAVQDISNGLPDQLLSYNISDNLSRFWGTASLNPVWKERDISPHQQRDDSWRPEI
ncbi:UBAP1-MVB12-associated (UMA)-domain containing protein 1 isoform X3 [Gopherus evgoodei]|uniref:UBAP1-MVB12-associated (UMA)-domain containing protein 1 isoform X3 n=1 Tax=Gopherus evgoodei TaxID=1825980 RepID=UPI0011CF61C2|nr:UBAP1-MVB12-associated (UMA)-domain containing protein 1 isoform X3 [Gopherus evgoodei]